MACYCLCLTCLGSLPARAQITFTASELPAVAGDYVDEYVSANTDPSAMIGTTGGPQIWDFSQAPQSADIVRRMAIVLTTDGGQQASFPKASYAEYYTDDTGTQERDYYNISNSFGRYYFGSYIPNEVTNTFSPPAIDIPAIAGYGTNWSYVFSTSYGGITETDTVSAAVDAYGTVLLPQLGSFPALRVNQLTTNVEYLPFVGPSATNYIREYYWLVPGFDKAVHIVSQQDSTPPPAKFTSAVEVRRVFATNYVMNVPSPVGSLRINLLKGKALLNWLVESNASAYQVQAVGDLAMTNWLILASPATNFWSEPLTSTQRFYRVFVEP